MNLQITSESPETALFFGVVATITGALLIIMTGNNTIPKIVLAILGVFWVITGLLGLWFGWRYLRTRQK